MMKKFALIVAGGTGKRMGSETPKQFLLLKNKPVLMHTIEAFINYDPQMEIHVVLPESQIEEWKKLCKKYSFPVLHTIMTGGKERFYSVKNGLQNISETGIVFIHDGVRPMVSRETLQRCYEMASEKGSAIPVIPVSESIRKIDGENSMAVKRSEYVLVQTPQTFRTTEIKQAYQQKYVPSFTDDASVLEAFGKSIYVVDGNRENIKITYPNDLIYVGSYLKNS